MNNWINENKRKVMEFSDTNEEVVPVLALEELFSKSGEQLAREMYPYYAGEKINMFSERAYNRIQDKYRESFLEAYNLQQVNIASLRTDVEKANNLFNSIKIPFDVDEMRSNYDRMAEENGQMLVNCANWKRELAAKDAENEALKKELEELKAQLYRYKPLNPQP
jgi:hypothetical protein